MSRSPEQIAKEAALKPRMCGVGWRNQEGKYTREPCPNPATHRAICTNGDRLTVFQVCEECARMTVGLKYKADHFGGPAGQTEILVGDPLWLIWPPLEPKSEEATLDAEIAEWARRKWPEKYNLIHCLDKLREEFCELEEAIECGYSLTSRLGELGDVALTLSVVATILGSSAHTEKRLAFERAKQKHGA